MSTLDGPIWSRNIIALTCPARSHFQRTLSKGRWGQCWDKRYRSSKEEEEYGDENGREKGRRKRKQATDFEEAVCCSSVIVQRAA